MFLPNTNPIAVRREPGPFDAQVLPSGTSFDAGNDPEVVNRAHMEAA